MLVSAMLVAEMQRAEGARYAACLVLLPGLWAGPTAWRSCAGYLAHRGWESRLLDLRPVPGGVETRAAAVAEYVAGLGVPTVLVAHGGGAATALAAARRQSVQGVVLVCPLVPGSRGARELTLGVRTALPLLLGRPVPPPRSYQEDLLLGALPDPIRARVRAGLGPEAAAVVWETARGVGDGPVAGVASAVVSGGRDTLLPGPEAATLAASLGADHVVLPEAGAWPLAGPGWQEVVAAVHRWIVQRLGAPLLELYPEAMAAREEEEEEGEEP
jgi:pimeloyl-ACP methyl ester carboxylesterase